MPLDKLGTLKPGEVAVELRFINTDGETEVWMVEANKDFLSAIRRGRDTPLAYIDDGIDIRIANQRNTIDRMLSHLHMHCPEYENPPGRCYFSESS